MIIAGAAMTNGSATAHLIIENTVPILRKKDILREEDAHSPARRIYYTVQLMYLDQENLTAYHATYWSLAREFIKAAPSSLNLIDRISEQILGGRYYRALKQARRLILYEKTLMERNQEN